MAAMTFTQMVTFLKDRNCSDSSARTIRNYTKIIQDANFALHNEGKFEFDRRRGRLNYLPPTTNGTAGTATAAVAAGATAVTFTGTSVVAADAGRTIRFESEDLAYILSSVNVGAQTAVLESAYQASANLTAGDFVISSERMVLPTDFRDFCDPVLDTLWGKLTPKDMADILQFRLFVRSTGTPVYYSVESVLASDGTELWYCWLHPAPTILTSIDFMYYGWPVQPSADADTFGLPIAAEPVLREFCKAFLVQEQQGMEAGQGAIEAAKRMCRKSLAHFMPKVNGGQREEWTPQGDTQSGQQLYYPTNLPLR